MSGIVCQKEPPIADRPNPAVSEFDGASCGYEIHGDGQMLRIDVSDLDCEPVLVADLSLESDRALQSTAHL